MLSALNAGCVKYPQQLHLGAFAGNETSRTCPEVVIGFMNFKK